MTIITCSKTTVSNTTWIKTAPNHLWLIHSIKQLSQGHVMMLPWLLANSTNLIILSETLEINGRPTSKIYCQQWRDSTKTLGKIHKYKLLRKTMDYWQFVHNLWKQNLSPSYSSDDYTVLPPGTKFNTIQELLVPRLGTEPSTWPCGGLEPHTNSSSWGGSNRSARSRVSSLTGQKRFWPKHFWGVLIYQDCNSTRNITTSFCYIHVFTLKSLSSKDTSDLWRGTG